MGVHFTCDEFSQREFQMLCNITSCLLSVRSNFNGESAVLIPRHFWVFFWASDLQTREVECHSTNKLGYSQDRSNMESSEDFDLRRIWKLLRSAPEWNWAGVCSVARKALPQTSGRTEIQSGTVVQRHQCHRQQHSRQNKTQCGKFQWWMSNFESSSGQGKLWKKGSCRQVQNIWAYMHAWHTADGKMQVNKWTGQSRHFGGKMRIAVPKDAFTTAEARLKSKHSSTKQKPQWKRSWRILPSMSSMVS